jgi:hypothetical protein
MKYSMTCSGIEPATFWFVAQYLNHCATAVPYTVPYQAASTISVAACCIAVSAESPELVIVITAQKWVLSYPQELYEILIVC